MTIKKRDCEINLIKNQNAIIMEPSEPIGVVNFSTDEQMVMNIFFSFSRLRTPNIDEFFTQDFAAILSI